MRKIHSHYDNLTVSRNASPDVIRAAYRALCQKYHPDKHNQDPKFVRIMAIINASYQVLMDPEQRLQHDIWLDEQERKLRETGSYDDSSDTKENSSGEYKEPFKEKQESNTSSTVERTENENHARNLLIVILVVVIFSICFLGTILFYFDSRNKHTANQANSAQYQDVRKSLAPNGLAWPQQAGYLSGYAVANNDGFSNITIRNDNGSSDIYLKLQTVNGYTLRHVYIPKGQSFRMQHLSPGVYILKYKQLDTGQMYKADSVLQIDEINTNYGIQYTNIEFTIFPVSKGNTGASRLREKDF